MISLLTENQKLRYEEFKDFIKTNVEPYASKWDYNQEMPDDFLSLLGSAGYLGSNIPTESRCCSRTRIALSSRYLK